MYQEEREREREREGGEVRAIMSKDVEEKGKLEGQKVKGKKRVKRK